MSGTGGKFFSSRTTPLERARRIREAEDQARDDGFETLVGDYLASLLSDFNSRDVDGIQEVLEDIKADLENEIEGTIDTLFGGSVSRHTYLEGLSDVDTLVLLNKSELAQKSPKEVKSYLLDVLRDRYGEENVWEGKLAVTVCVDKNFIQFLPALRHLQGVKIANSRGDDWSKVNPQRFTEALTEANKKMNGKLVPCIKLAKAIVATLPEKRQITGYHTESMAINVFRNYDGPKTPKAMLRHFFENASEQVKEPIRDSSGQSVHVDEYLGSANSLIRQTVSHALDRIRRKLLNADGAASLDRWKELFE